ncbi:MAG: hypothetical protein KBG82_02745 [Spirochaetes bacterium]|nr:hypothetical protein [Spirochaetota bacterium]
MVRTTSNFNNECDIDWYAVICDKFFNLEELSSNKRYQIRKGLKNCKVEKADPGIIYKDGYDVYISAFDRYKSAKPLKKVILEKTF